MAQSEKNEFQDPDFVVDDALYCQEGNWEEDELNEDGFLLDESSLYSYSNNNHYSPAISDSKLNPQKKLIFSEQDLHWENDELSNLLSKEERNLLHKSLQKDPYLAAARCEAVGWMLRVHAHYSFTVLTAVLAVNYLDRFLFSFQFQREKPWMTQLTAVACLSLAAKVEETRVPFLLDLQVEDAKFIFEAKTIQRMEILVLSTLQWKMNPVSPHSFLDYITRRLGLKDNLCREFLKRCERVLLSSVSDSRFMGYLPSEMAAAIMLHVVHNVEPCIGYEYQDQLLGILGIDRDTVELCTILSHTASRSHLAHFIFPSSPSLAQRSAHVLIVETKPMDQFFPPSLTSYYHLIFISIALLFSTTIFVLTKTKKHGRVPPGPPGWPIVGNLFQFTSSGKQFFEYVRELIPVYGPIMTLKMGSRKMIIVSGAELVHEALIERGQTFASRPSENPTRIVFSCNKFTVNAALYGSVWRSLRRNMVQNMLSSSRLKEFKDVRDSAMDKLIEKLKVEAESNDGAVGVLKNARFAVFCILLAMCFGVEMDEETIEKMDQMMKLVLITLDPRIDDYLPILRPFFSKQRKNAMEVRQQQIDTLLPFIEKRRAILRDPGSDPKAATFSYLDTIFDMKIENRKHAPTDPEIVTLCSEFLNGGTDTTGTAIEWAIGRLIENPRMQEKLYSEIRAAVGPDRKVGEKDLDQMPYLHAFVKELLRRHPPTYFSLTHAVMEPTTLGGYEIPTDTNVEIYLPGISEDPRLWSDPQRFDPERFVTGKEDADITGVKNTRMLPFGAGRRICPGLSMATVHVNLMIARMVQEFEWGAYPVGSEVDFSEKVEFTVVMKNPLRAIIKPRV